MIVLYFLHCVFIAGTFALEQTTFKLAYAIYAFLYFVGLIVIKSSAITKKTNSRLKILP